MTQRRGSGRSLKARIQRQLVAVKRVVGTLMTMLRKAPEGSGEDESVTVYVGHARRVQGETLYLGDLPRSVTESELELLVEGLGVTPLSIVVVGDAGRPKRYAFVDVPRGAVAALIPALNGHVLRGHTIVASQVASGPKAFGGGRRKRSSSNSGGARRR